MRRSMQALALAVLLIYPVIVYVGAEHWRPRHLAWLLLAGLVLRVVSLRSLAEWRSWRLPILTGMALAICVVVVNDMHWLQFYPVLVSVSMLLVFGGSLIWPPTIIERIARFEHGGEIDAREVQYTRRLTEVWCVFFLFNAAVAWLTTRYPGMALWTLYNGLLSYILMAILLFGERLFRARLRDWLVP